MKEQDRKEYLLRQVLKLFKQQRDSIYVMDINDMIVIYDGCECDGQCLCYDIMNELDIDDLDDLEEEEIVDETIENDNQM